MNEVGNVGVVEEFDNKTVDLLLQEIYIKQAEKIVKNFEDAIKKLSVSKNTNDDANLNCKSILS